MPDLPRRRLAAKKFSPALVFGHISVDEDLDADVVKAEFGAGSEGQPLSLLRKVLRIWVQDGDLFAETTDEF